MTFAKPGNPAKHTLRNAYIIPFLVFMGFLGLSGLLKQFFLDYGTTQNRALPIGFTDPNYWIFPLQTIVCGFLLLKYRRLYVFGNFKSPLLIATFTGVLVLVIWIAPQEFLGMEKRWDGFDPSIFIKRPDLYFGTLFFRFLRLVIVVPFLEEIFWRGFLLRFLIREDFQSVPFGTFSLFSFTTVTILFGLAHFGPDFVPAILTGILYNWIAIHTRSLWACIWAHALTNLLLGIYIMQTGQWGFW